MLRIVLPILIVLFCGQAFADPIERQPVYDRAHPGFEVPGIRLGELLLHPSAKVMGQFNDNLYATNAIKRSDFVTYVSPGMTLRSLNERRGLKAELRSEHALHNRYSRENFTDLRMSLAPYLQLSRASRLDARIAYDREHDARTAEASSNNIGAEEPVRWTRITGRLGWEYKPGRTALRTFLQQENRRHENVGSLDGVTRFINDDRDRDETRIGAEISYDLTDQNRLYFRADMFDRDYSKQDFNDLTLKYDGLNRDSRGADLRAGVNIALTPLVRLNANGGYYQQDFSSNGFSTIETLVGDVLATWQVTALTTIDLGASRDVFETNQPDASAFARNKVTARVTHELRRNILLGAEMAGGKNTYQGSDREDDFWGVGPNLTYKMNRNIDWKAGYLYDRRESNQPGADYDRHRVFVGMQVKF